MNVIVTLNGVPVEEGKTYTVGNGSSFRWSNDWEWVNPYNAEQELAWLLADAEERLPWWRRMLARWQIRRIKPKAR